jgi:Uma2 family endonuclease
MQKAISRMTTTAKPRGPWTRADLELLPDTGAHDEIVDGELFVSKLPHWQHQRTCGNFFQVVDKWSEQTGAGEVSFNPGVLFTNADDVVPDVARSSNERLAVLLDEAGHLTGAPALGVEVLSPGPQQERRDRQAKRKFYETHGVREYWIADWRKRQVEVYRREEGQLRLLFTLLAEDMLTTPFLPGFVCPIQRLFT